MRKILLRAGIDDCFDFERSFKWQELAEFLRTSTRLSLTE